MEEGSPKDENRRKTGRFACEAQPLFADEIVQQRLIGQVTSLTRASVIVKCTTRGRTDKFRPIQSTLVPQMPFRKDNGNPKAVKRTKHATRLLRISVPRTTVSGSSTWVLVRAGHSPPSHKQACTSRIANDITPAQANGPLREP